ncbi:alkyl hydroperoxide reductase [Pollutimonas nitritireducens]|uniref:Alkyl hydroperoxide reductase n=1 Tax=Pollutimonas nitritireducens TaxID=2045209 RepID=A0A2N4UEM9_9BURK|nr:redoxin domain-containing protein [Pollutimonas nitritireducens]PLC53469.1 alkyl hydroperoxide reductase [Pollutimonas nitritireducens]
MWKSRFAALLAGVGLVASVAVVPMAQAAVTVGDSVELPEIQFLDGRKLPKGHFNGKPVIIAYWASWCPYCGRQNPYVQKLWEQSQGKGLEILTVSIDRVEGDAVGYVEKYDYTFPVAMETEALREVLGKRKVIPNIFVIKADGRIAEVIPGEMFEEDVLDLIKYTSGPVKAN